MPPSRYARREVLRLGGAGLFGAVAGCSASDGDGTPAPTSDTPAPTDTPTRTEPTTEPVTAEPTDARPGPGEDATLTTGPTVSVDSRFDGESCPAFGDPERTVCYHAVGEDPAVYLRPEDGREEVGRSTENCVPSHTFTMVNRTDAELWTNTGTWRVMRSAADGWQQVLPDGDVGWCAQCVERLPPSGGFFQWALAIDNVHPCPRSANLACVGPLTTEPGRHAFVADVYEGEPGSAGAPAVRCVVLFELVGEPVECG